MINEDVISKYFQHLSLMLGEVYRVSMTNNLCEKTDHAVIKVYSNIHPYLLNGGFMIGETRARLTEGTTFGCYLETKLARKIIKSARDLSGFYNQK